MSWLHSKGAELRGNGERIQILLVYNGSSRFVDIDRAILAEKYTVASTNVPSWTHIHPTVVWRDVSASDVIFCWFASWHSVLPLLFGRLQRKPSILVVGGYDTASVADIGYGHQRGGLPGWISRVAMSLSGVLVANSFYSQREVAANVGLALGRIEVVRHGLDDEYGHLSHCPREQIVLTVGYVHRSTLRRKGLELFVQTARLLPSARFILVGKWVDGTIDHLRGIAGPNVEFTGWLDQNALKDLYVRAGVYVQMSRHEGFGLSVAEAMLAGCLPVVSAAGALPEVVGDAGLIVHSFSPADWATAIGRGLRASFSERLRARTRVLREFPLNSRRKALRDLVDRLVSRCAV